jgi:5-methylcytosine rRNA methyltransferase NSUN4
MSDFDQFYSQFWGPRWPRLRQALEGSEQLVARKNLFSDFAENPSVEEIRKAVPRGPNGLLAFYLMDKGSIAAATSLEVQAGDLVLDLCAAPGGKSLILIEGLAESGEILLNDVSAARRDRLKKVIQQYVPQNVRPRVRITGKDGGVFSKTHPETFDRILVDAPCSGERHLLKSPEHFKEWKPSVSARLAQRQYALVSGAIEAVKPGGRIVYSTCSLSDLENDQVIGRILEKKSDRISLLQIETEAEKTKFGNVYLPDESGFGPLYWAVLEKKD